jgi:hypothetical protein
MSIRDDAARANPAPAEPTHAPVPLASLTTPAETFAALRDRGFRPVLIYPRGFPRKSRGGKPASGKEPIGPRWGLEPWTDAKAAEIFGWCPGAGVGMCLGPGCAPGDGWLGDAEGDGPEAEASRATLFGGEALETMGWGSVRGGHQAVRCDGGRLRAVVPRLKKYQVKDANQPGVFKIDALPGLELRLGGFWPDGTVKQLQSVVPPTAGTDGTPRVWNGVETVADAPEAFYRVLEAIAAEAAPNRAHLWLMAALANAEQRIRATKEPHRRNRYRDEALTLAGYLHYHETYGVGYTEAELERTLKNALAVEVQPGDPVVEETVNDAIRDGKAKPLTIRKAEIHAAAAENGRKKGVPAPFLPPFCAAAAAGVARDNSKDGNALGNGDGGPEGFLLFAPGEERGEEEDDTTPLPPQPWVEPPDPSVYYGLSGDFVRAVDPTTEADPLAVLVQFLLSAGSVMGHTAYFEVEQTRHYANENALAVGESALSRKGTSGRRVRRVLELVDPEWCRRVADGLSSGEGLLTAVRDPVVKQEPIREKGRIVGYQPVMVDEGVGDKRLYVDESEFGGVLRANERDGNKLSVYVRRLWDSGTCGSLTKNPLRTTDAHVSVVGHITEAELKERLSGSDLFNGFANRFLWFAVQRSKKLPFGGEGFDPAPFAERLRRAVDDARTVGRVTMDQYARALWESAYGRLTTPAPGVLGAVTNRGAPHVLRLALIYALLDGRAVIEEEHLVAALCLWDASFRCAAHIFGASVGDPRAETVLKALRAAPAEGLTRTDIYRAVFKGKGKGKTDAIKAALQHLIKHGLAVEDRVENTGGRPRTSYRACETGAISAKSLRTMRPQGPVAENDATLFAPGQRKKGAKTCKKGWEGEDTTPPTTSTSTPPAPNGEAEAFPDTLEPPDCGGCLRLECRQCNPPEL